MFCCPLLPAVLLCKLTNVPEACPPEQNYELSIVSIQTDTTGKEVVQFASSTFFIYLPAPVSFVFLSFLQKVRQNNVSYIDVGSSSTLTQVPFSLLFYRSIYSSIWLSNWVVNCERDSWLRRWFSVAFRELVFLCQCDGSISCCTHFEWALCFLFMASLSR